MKRSLAVVVMLAGGLWAFIPGATGAATPKPLNLITSPLPINLVVDPGHSVTTDIKVKQNDGDDEQLQVTLMKFGAYGDAGKPQLLSRAPGDDYFDWVKFDKNTFDAPDNVWQTIHMTINVPKTAAFGYYYAVVFSRVGDDTRQGGNTNSINGGSAVLVLLDANAPGAKKQVAVESLTSNHGVYEFLPASFSVKLRNTGNVHVVPTGNIFILKGNKQVAALDLNGEQGNILPNSNRIYPVDWTDGFPHYEEATLNGAVKEDKNSNPVMNLIFNNGGGQAKDVTPHLRFGQYTAHLVAVYDDGTRDVPLEATVSFWVIPWRLILGALLVAILVGAGTYSLTRGLWQRITKWMSRFRRQS